MPSRRRFYPVDPAGGQWHLDKRVPLGFLLAIGLQSLAAAWWASGMDKRVEVLERTQALAGPQGDRIVRLETKVDVLGERVVEIKNLLTPPVRR